MGVLGIVGNSRKGGNADILARKALGGRKKPVLYKNGFFRSFSALPPG